MCPAAKAPLGRFPFVCDPISPGTTLHIDQHGDRRHEPQPGKGLHAALNPKMPVPKLCLGDSDRYILDVNALELQAELLVFKHSDLIET
jgi:hypothetical protein